MGHKPAAKRYRNKKITSQVEWSMQSQWCGITTRGKAILALVVSHAPNGEWVSAAVEGTKPPKNADNVAKIEHTFSGHAHHVIGSFATDAAARRAADAYAAKWQSGKAKAPDCACDEISAPTKRRAAASRRPAATRTAARAA